MNGLFSALKYISSEIKVLTIFVSLEFNEFILVFS